MRLRYLPAVLALAFGGLAVGCVRPNPIPTPQPDPPPPPAPTPAKVVIVEDTLSAGQARGLFLSNKKVSAFFRNSGLEHAIYSVGAVDRDNKPLGGKAGEFIAAAKSKSLPYMFVLDAAGKTIRDEPLSLDADKFVALFAPPHKRVFGCELAPPKLAWPTFGGTPATRLIPRDQWKEVDFESFLPAVKDQDGVGACASFAAIEALETGREVGGEEYVKLSPGYTYGHVNGGRDRGSLLEDNLAHLVDRGTVSSKTVPDLRWQSRYWPKGAAEEARSYRIAEALLCPTFDAIASAVQQGFPVVVGLMWHDNFEPDADGWLPSAGRGSAGGHALLAYGLTKRTDRTGKVTWGLLIRNSWGPGWGIGGNCVIPETHFNGAISGYWAVRSAVRSSGAAEPVRRSRPPVDPADVLQLAP